MLSASSSEISPHQTTRASRAGAAHARSRSPLPPADYSTLDAPPSILSPTLPAPSPHPHKSLSYENRAPAAPSPFRSAQTLQSRASCPTHPSPPTDPGPSLSNSRSAPACRLRPAASPPPSSVSTQNPPWSHPARLAYLPPPLHVSCTPPHQCCRIPLPHSPQSAISAPRSTIPN